MSFTGIVRNGVITLEPDTKLPDGTEVSITPLGQTAARLRDHRDGDPDDAKAAAAFAAAEVRYPDPLKGEVFFEEESAGQKELRELLSDG